MHISTLCSCLLAKLQRTRIFFYNLNVWSIACPKMTSIDLRISSKMDHDQSAIVRHLCGGSSREYSRSQGSYLLAIYIPVCVPFVFWSIGKNGAGPFRSPTYETSLHTRKATLCVWSDWRGFIHCELNHGVSAELYVGRFGKCNYSSSFFTKTDHWTISPSSSAGQLRSLYHQYNKVAIQTLFWVLLTDLLIFLKNKNAHCLWINPLLFPK